MRLLIIEDNQELLSIMEESLRKAEFQVDTTVSGLEGEELAYANEYDAILLDLNLPDKDGLAILSFLRESNVNTPVLIITARYEVENRTAGLNLGADDYIVKPFQLSELHARIHAVIRRFYGRTQPDIKVGGLCVSPLRRSVSYQGKEIGLKPKEFDILEYLAYKYPDVATSESIAEHVYNNEFNPFSSVLRVHIAQLRRKVLEVAGVDLVKTVRGKGYQLCEK
ncbi:response regulator transcription factor [Breznakia pachnodae]|uniref:DNA-binding response OmpR family regulator n=1 Tax=Breznakia pachnodae TaxID=265178 RepID=A0ABU0E6D4_9FIRM|nr:response regulator transcription factor [Breznakia pachnodae]MDQ0362355.1 DNA-binding response OmpR family regulator [Breznakia pachnodae]